MRSVPTVPRHPRLASLHRLWLRHRADGHLPAAEDFDPLDLRPWGEHLVVLDIESEAQFVYAYYGNVFAAAFGGDRVGQSIDDLPAQQRAILQEEYDRARRQGVPLTRVYTADFGDGVATWERLVLPLASNGKTVDKLMVAAFELPGDADDA
ncbi:MAG TPA: PAS domain-containing protein [Stellaceae bacterium]